MANALAELNAMAAILPPVSNERSITQYFRAADVLRRQGEAQLKVGENERGYVMLSRFLLLVLKRLPRHRQYRREEYREQRAALRKKCAATLEQLEHVKALLEEQLSPKKEPKALSPALLMDSTPPFAVAPLTTRQDALIPLPDDAGPLDEVDVFGLDSWTSSQTAISGTQSSILIPGIYPPVAPIPPVDDSWRAALRYGYSAIEFSAMTAPPENDEPFDAPLYPKSIVPVSREYVPMYRAQPYNEPEVKKEVVPVREVVPVPEVVPVKKEQVVPKVVEVVEVVEVVPEDPRPDPTSIVPRKYPPVKEAAKEDPRDKRSAPARSPKTPKTAKWRRVVLRDSVIRAFLRAADRNTMRGIETCAVLCGKQNGNDLVITHLLIPKQIGEPSTCSTTDEEELVMIQIKDDLLTLGWIHTHPTQSCFMSSMDVHTHAHHQSMLSESIAIVCAPRSRPSLGIFNLIEPEGLNEVTQCKLKGFHPHKRSPLYQTCPHVVVVKGKVKVIDFR